LKLSITKILTSIALIGGCFIPLLMDLDNTHLFNDLWDAHARTHLVWMISSFFLLFILGIYFLWIKNEEFFPAMLSLCVLIGYAISAITISFYGGEFLGEGGIEPKPFGIPINLLHFSSMLVIQLISLFLLLIKKKI
tara:strand:- start:2750 stop:3160 length:411 start_codon:yes stop_codon:yes gene_type:complete